MYCTYKGNFYEKHETKKRRIIGPAKDRAILSLSVNGMSSETYRELEANRVMKIGRYLLQNYLNY